jgi:hypothetical protein
MFYSCAKIAEGSDKIKYTEVYDNGQKCLLILYAVKGEELEKKQDVKRFAVFNNGLDGKEYEIIVGLSTVYKGRIKCGENIFPIKNFPISKISLQDIYILIKNINYNNFNLSVINEMADTPAVPVITEECLGIDYYFYEWEPFEDCITCKNKTNLIHKYIPEDRKNYFLVNFSGAAGLRYQTNCYDYSITYCYNTTLKLLYNFSIDDYAKVNTKVIKIKKKIINLSEYNNNNALGSILTDNMENDNENIIIVENKKNKCVLAKDCVFEYLLAGEYICNLEFICPNNTITSADFFFEMQDKWPKKSFSKIQINFPMEVNNSIYEMSRKNLFIKMCMIQVRTKNNNPIEIAYDQCFFHPKLRENVSIHEGIARFDMDIEKCIDLSLWSISADHIPNNNEKYDINLYENSDIVTL